MTKDELQYIIYTDYFRISGTTLRFRDKLKVWLNYNSHPGFRIMFFYRHCCYYRNANKLLYWFWSRCFRSISEHYRVELPVTVKIGSGFIFYHADGIVLHPNTVIGRNCSILQQVTIGNTIKSKDRVAIIEDNVNIGAGAKIIGSIHIGSNVAIGANAVVTHDVPDNCSVAGIPARVLNEDNHNLPYHTDYLSFNDWKERKHK